MNISHRTIRRTCIAAALLLVIGLVGFAPQAHAAPANFRITFVVDNIGSHPEYADKKFRFDHGYIRDTFFIRGGNPDIGYYYNDVLPGETVDAPIYLNNAAGVYFKPDAGLPNCPSLVSIDCGENTEPINDFTNGGKGQPIDLYNIIKFTNTNADAACTVHVRINDGIPTPPLLKPNVNITSSKQIDYLGDGVSNPDSSHTSVNDYRAYMTSKVEDKRQINVDYKSKNIIFVLDTSGSMGGYRLNTLKSSLTSMVDELSESDDADTFAVISFADSLKSVDKNMGAAEAKQKIQNLRASGLTNYTSGLAEISGCTVDTRENIVIFFTDGEPNRISKELTGTPNNIDYGFMLNSSYARYILSHKAGPVDSFYSLYIGTNQMNGYMLDSVTQGANVTGVKGSVRANDNAELANLFDTLAKQLSKPKPMVELSDTLSENVTYYNGSNKLLVTDSSGTHELVEGQDYTFSYDTATKTVSASVKSTTDEDKTYTFSYDVRTSARGIHTWLALNHAYPSGEVGDSDTDYPGNSTSSGKPGFFMSNSSSIKVSYDLKGQSMSVSKDYTKPVVQAVIQPNVTGAVTSHITLYNMMLTDGTFTFGLYDDNNNLVSEGTNTADGTVIFPDLNFTRDGTYHYTMKMLGKNPTDPGHYENMQYDDSTINVTVKVDIVEDTNNVAHFQPTVTYDPTSNNFYATYGIAGRFN